MNITINELAALKDNDGLTLKKYSTICYKSGYQVATEGVEVKSLREAWEAVQSYNGTCGVWFANGIYYIDKSHRTATKREAMEIGRACRQISILSWRTMSLLYC